MSLIAITLSPVEVTIVVTIIAVIMFLIGINIFLVFGIWSILFATFTTGFEYGTFSVAFFEQMNSFPLAAIPPFIAVGVLLNYTAMSDEIIDFSKSIGGWLPGAVGNTSIVTSGIFSSISGSNPATTAAIGEAMLDDLIDDGYSPEFAAATIAAGGTVGVIIPPSIMMILYGVTFNVSVTSLFLAGIIPGIAMVFCLMFVCSLISFRSSMKNEYKFDIVESIYAFWNIKNTLFTIILLLGGIFSGIFTPSESASIATAYIIFSNFVLGRMSAADALSSFRRAMELTGVILPLLVTAIMVQQGLSYLGLQDAIGSAVAGLGSPALIIVVMSIILLITGMTLSSVPNMIITAPMLAPAANALGLSPLMWGVIFLMNDAIGFITPPYGINLYVASRVSGIDYIEIAKAALPYLFALYSLWLIFLLFPEINILAS